jgi:DNA-binding FadR family transcriptional regulator
MATYQEHERIYLAVKNKQSEEARAAMVDHLSQVEATMRKIEISEDL